MYQKFPFPTFTAAAMAAILNQACSPTPAPSTVDDSKAAQEEVIEPIDIKAQFEREAAIIGKHTVHAEGLWSASMEAKTDPVVVQHEQALEVIADLGWDSELHCFVHQGAIHAATMIHAMLQAAPPNVQFQTVTPYGFDKQGLVPWMGIRAIYQVEQDGVLMNGDYKLMVMPRSEYPVWCFHDAAGYSQSFLRVTSEFAKSFEFAPPQSAPVRGELWRLTLDQLPVGFSLDTTYALAKGQRRRVSTSASFIPVAPGQLTLEDRSSVVTSDASGALISGSYTNFENGAPSMALEVERARQGYRYSGRIGAQDVSGTFKTKKPILTSQAFDNRIAALAKKPQKATFDQWEYIPGIDPAQASKVTYEVTPENEALKIVASVGQRAVTMHTNASGVVERLQIPVDSLTIESRLVEAIGN